MSKRIRRRIIIIGIGMIILMVGIVFLLYIGNNGIDRDAVMATSDHLSKEEIEKELENKADKDIMVVSMNTKPVFKTGDSKGNLNIEISPRNYYTVRVEITLEKDGTLIYRSGKIAPGYMIKETKLDKELEKGSYMCTATFIAFDQKDKEVKRASAQIQIEIKE